MSGTVYPLLDERLRVAVVGAGPAGIYVADALVKSGVDVDIDVFERLPAPYGLIRYGVAPDHPRIKGIVTALHRVLDTPQVRLLGNIEYGTDLDLDDLRRHYDAVVFATGADQDRDLAVPGIDLPGSWGGADFVSWFDGHPDVDRSWPLDARQVAVIGAGNVALDVARMLSKPADELLSTEIPDNVHRGLHSSAVTEVHLFARRGPAQSRFTPLELRELDHSPSVEVIVDPEDVQYDDDSLAAVRSDSQTRLVVRELERYALRTAEHGLGTRPRKLFLHFFADPVAVLGEHCVTGLRTERTELDGGGSVRRTGRRHDWPVQAVYRCVGYRSRAIPGLPWDDQQHVVPHVRGRVVDAEGDAVPGLYVNGWVKRGPVGLIGHTKGDALETATSLLEDLRAGVLRRAPRPALDQVVRLLAARGVECTSWDGWGVLDAHERALGAASALGGGPARERIKVVDRAQMVQLSRLRGGRAPATRRAG